MVDRHDLTSFDNENWGSKKLLFFLRRSIAVEAFLVKLDNSQSQKFYTFILSFKKKAILFNGKHRTLYSFAGWFFILIKIICLIQLYLVAHQVSSKTRKWLFLILPFFPLSEPIPNPFTQPWTFLHHSSPQSFLFVFPLPLVSEKIASLWFVGNLYLIF